MPVSVDEGVAYWGLLSFTEPSFLEAFVLSIHLVFDFPPHEYLDTVDDVAIAVNKILCFMRSGGE
jgi:hypothetical protein